MVEGVGWQEGVVGKGLSMFGTQGLYLYQILRAFSKPTKDA